MTGNKKYNSSKLSPDSERLLTSFGINLSTELSVSPGTKLHLNNDSLNSYSGLIKLLRSKSASLESPLQLAKKVKIIKANMDFNLD